MKSLDSMMKNKAVLYGVLFITVTNVFGYLMIRNYEAIVFFALVAYISSEFTKNNILVCLVALLMTNILLAVVQGRKVYESMKLREGATGGEKPDAATDEAAADEPVVDEAATKAAGTEGLSSSLSDSKMKQHMANLDRIEGLLSKQEGLVGSLSKIENMMAKLENMGAKRISRRDD
tara:strand:+ start:532 stop:1062 length:531 start_codon:yes stop_codon:yes gene_type:complete